MNIQTGNHMGFSEYNGDLMGLPTNENHRVYRWDRDDCKVLFSVTRRGCAAVGHFASDKRGLRHLKDAINQFTALCMVDFDWCKMVISLNERESIRKLLKRIGFVPVADYGHYNIMMRRY